MNTKSGKILLTVLLFFLTLLCSYSFAQVLPDHSPQWVSKYGGEGVEYGLTDPDNIASTDFIYCKMGNWIDGDLDEATGNINLKFNSLTAKPWDNGNQDLFVLYSNRNLTNITALDPPNYIEYSPHRWIIGSSTVWSNDLISFEPPYSYKRYDLFRYYHFNNYLIDEVSGTQINQTTDMRKVVILVHGWNPDSDPDKYDYDYAPGNRRFYELRNNIKSELEGTEWKLITYHWERDADTGGRNIGDSAENGTKAAEAAHLHGLHLGELLNCISPNLEKIHFIAHSAGSWAARSASRHLLKNNSNVNVQITLLDPFMPNEVLHITSKLGISLMNQVDSINGNNRIFLLENYYSNDVAVPGTDETFLWREADKNRCVGDDIRTGFDNVGIGFYGHGAPVEFYSLTVEDPLNDPLADSLNAGELQKNPTFGRGWAESMFYAELMNVGPHIIQVPISFNSVFPE